MEDLLWMYPDDFFPRHGFKQATRQFTLSDGGRLDISFRDSNERLWVIEVKAVPIRIADADQVHRYARKLREANPNDPPIPAVVAPVINSTVRENFDRWGVEHFEISEATFHRVASERGISIEPEPPTAGAPVQVLATHKVASEQPCGDGPANGLYTLAWAPYTKKGAANTPTVWHYRRAGATACGAHGGATALRTNAVYLTADAVPAGADMCNKGCRAAAQGAGQLSGA